jgi:hypothetical protein
LSQALPAGATVVDARATQGSCSGPTCALGTIAGGDVAVAVFLLRLDRAGPASSTATVSSSTPELDPADNSASAATTVVPPPPAADPPPVLALAVGTPPKLRRALRRGVAAVVGCTEGCAVGARLKLRARNARRLKLPRVVARGSRRLASAGAGTIRLRFTRPARRRLARLRRVKLTLNATATDSAGQRDARRARVTLKR